ncbi:MAG TPA: Fe-S cluster assembly protein SufD [Chloroflexota bacterium]|jgi:Fe-S cluster assembly protein SufD
MTPDTSTTTRLALTRETVEALVEHRQEPDWLRQIRLDAFEAYERLPLPDQRTEGWRRTSLTGLPKLDTLSPRPGAPTPSTYVEDPLAEKAGASLFAFRNGMSMREDSLESGWVMDLQEALQEPLLAMRIEQHFSKIVKPDTDKFTALHYAFFNSGVVIFMPRATALEEPIWVNYHFDDPSQAALVHTLILMDDEAQATVVEDFTSNVGGLASGVVEQSLGANANLRYVNLQRWSQEMWSFSTQRAHLAADAHVRTLNVALGSRTARNSVAVVLAGRGSQADLLGIVATGGRQHVDFETLQDHFGDATRSDLVIHDALRERASANFTGLIRINKSAHQTESSQEQKNILLSDRAKADSDPKLEILNNDVIRCTHGAAVGPVDPEMLFYLQSRGMDRATAEQLIVEGFFQSTLAKLGSQPVQDAVWAAIQP